MASRGLALVAVLLLGALSIVSLVARGPDTIPPYATSWGPTLSGVPVDTLILVRWSERMNWISVEAAFSYTDGVLAYTQGTWNHDEAQNTSTFAPAVPFKPGTRYTVRFETTAMDPSGNRLDQNRNGIGGEPCDVGPPGFWDCLVWSFDTAAPPPDTTPPKILSTSPPNGGISATNAPILIRFSETMDTRSVEASLSYGDGFSLYTIADGTVSWLATSSPDDTIRYSPRLEFASGGVVTVNVNGTVARDAAGNRLDGNGDGTGGDDYTWSFAVAADARPPKVVSTIPAQGATNVSISINLRIVFTKAMDRTSAEAALSLSGPGAPRLGQGNGTVTWGGVRFPDDAVVFNPAPNLKTSVPYRFLLNGSVAKDREARSLDGNGDGNATGSPVDDFALLFTTEAEDRTPPTVADRSPRPAVTNVPPSTTITIVFSEPMNRTSVGAAFSYTDGASTFTIADGSSEWDGAHDILTFHPSRSLSLGITYTVTLNGSAARDEAGNRLNGGTDEVWSFAVAGQPDTTPPHVQWTSPINGQENVSRTARISIVFSEAMDKAKVEGAMGITGGASLTGFRWPNDATVEAATALPMGYRTSYAVFVLTGAKDLAGNSLTQVTQIAFTTEPWRGRVWGRVADETDAGVAGALVRLNGFSVVTNDHGEFSFETVEQGTYTLTVAREGYATYTQVLPLAPGQGFLGTITLRRPTVSAVDATLWGTVGAALFILVLIAMWLRRRRPRPGEHYETWKPAKVVVVEPGRTPPKRP